MHSFFQWIKHHKNLWFGLISIGALILLLVLLMDFIIMPVYTHKGIEMELPDVTEMHFNKALQLLESKDLQIVKDGDQFHDTYPESTVIAQNPSAFSRIKKGRRIYVIISAGEKLTKVPRLVGTSERDAVFLLKQAGLEPGEIYFEYNNYQPQGVVYAQSLDSGSELHKGTFVDITVSNGREPNRFLVPDVIGLSLDQAKKSIRLAGLRLGIITYEHQPTLLQDTIIRQSYDPDEETSQNTVIDLVVSKIENEL